MNTNMEAVTNPLTEISGNKRKRRDSEAPEPAHAATDVVDPSPGKRGILGKKYSNKKDESGCFIPVIGTAREVVPADKTYKDEHGYWRIGTQPIIAHKEFITSWTSKWARQMIHTAVDKNSNAADSQLPDITDEERADDRAVLSASLFDRLV